MIIMITGLTRSIGVSNFNSEQIADLIKNSSTVPAVNQVECHPYLSQEKLLQWCRQRGIHLTAYSPLARTGTAEEKNTTSPLDIPLIKELAAKYGVKTEPPADQPWGMRDFVIVDPTGVLWRIAQNTAGSDRQT